jgi:hypothetical protein
LKDPDIILKEYDVSHCLSVSSYISIFGAFSRIFSPPDIPESGAGFRRSLSPLDPLGVSGGTRPCSSIRSIPLTSHSSIMSLLHPVRISQDSENVALYRIDAVESHTH